MEMWIYEHSGGFVAAFMTGLVALISVAIKLSWQASQLCSSVDAMTKEVAALQLELKSARIEMKDEIHTIHARIDRHENRLDYVERHIVVPGSGTKYDNAHREIER